jgi:hypothetical protein
MRGVAVSPALGGTEPPAPEDGEGTSCCAWLSIRGTMGRRGRFTLGEVSMTPNPAVSNAGVHQATSRKRSSALPRAGVAES